VYQAMTTSKTVHAILSLIFSFIIAAFFLLLMGVDFIPIIFIIVYVGAIAILFLFVVMMLNEKTIKKKNLNKFIMMFMFFVLCWLFTSIDLNSDIKKSFYLIAISSDKLTNLDIIGQFLFNYLPISVFLAGFLLLIALIGVVILTYDFNRLSKNQEIFKQLSKLQNTLIF